MAEIPLQPRSALADVPLAAIAAVATLADTGPRSRFVLRAPQATAATLADALGVVPPIRINTANRAGPRTALKLGPDDWLIMAEPGAASTLPAAVAAVAGGAALALVDVSHRQAGLVLAGPRVEDILAGGCPLPLDLVGFPSGRATRTLFAKAEIVLWRTAPDRFEIETGRSFALYLAAYLSDTVAELAACDRLARAEKARRG